MQAKYAFIKSEGVLEGGSYEKKTEDNALTRTKRSLATDYDGGEHLCRTQLHLEIYTIRGKGNQKRAAGTSVKKKVTEKKLVREKDVHRALVSTHCGEKPANRSSLMSPEREKGGTTFCCWEENPDQRGINKTYPKSPASSLRKNETEGKREEKLALKSRIGPKKEKKERMQGRGERTTATSINHSNCKDKKNELRGNRSNLTTGVTFSRSQAKKNGKGK